jgi:hypothetical protein
VKEPSSSVPMLEHQTQQLNVLGIECVPRQPVKCTLPWPLSLTCCTVEFQSNYTRSIVYLAIEHSTSERIHAIEHT